jgi:acyl carrier protein
MVALESKFGIEINADSIRDLVSVKAILEAAEAKVNG